MFLTTRHKVHPKIELVSIQSEWWEAPWANSEG